MSPPLTSFTLDQRTVGCQPTLRLGQVDHRREDLLAVHLDLFQPHDVVGQRRHLLRAQAHTQLQVQLVRGESETGNACVAASDPPG